MSKIFIINGSPRKNFNTAKMADSFKKGAESLGVEVETINLYDLNFTGCKSCFACKLKDGKNYGRCAYPDELTPILDKISKEADGIVFASPIYFLGVTGEMKSFIERFLFPNFRYAQGFPSIAPKKLETATIYTLNAPLEFVQNGPFGAKMIASLDTFETFIEHLLTKPTRICAYNTYQFSDYSKYDCECFDEKVKAKYREEQFPKDLEVAFNEGVNMAKRIKGE